jgi:hypothetical protein
MAAAYGDSSGPHCPTRPMTAGVPGAKWLLKVACHQLSELREGHVLGDEAPTATGKAFLGSVASDAPARGYRLDVAPAAALLARRLDGNRQSD